MFRVKSFLDDTEYFLHSREVTLRGGKPQTIRYFSKSPDGALAEMPPGYVVRHNPRNGFVILSRIKGHSNPEEQYQIALDSDTLELPTEEPGSKAPNLGPIRKSIQLVDAAIISLMHEDPAELYSIDPRTFEFLIAELLQSQGFDVTLTQATRDGGYDMIASKHDVIGYTHALIECKRYSKDRRVGVGPVRSLLGVIGYESATRGLIVTTSSFSLPAKQVAERERNRLGLADNKDILEWLANYQSRSSS